MIRLVLILLMLAMPVWAVEPSEVLSDPVLENRARDISQKVRCPVCQNESIDESHAPVARELRLIIRERLVAGDGDQQVLDYLEARFGEFVLLTPARSGANLILWLAAPAMLVIGAGVGFLSIRRRSNVAESALSDQERDELDKILRQ